MGTDNRTRWHGLVRSPESKPNPWLFPKRLPGPGPRPWRPPSARAHLLPGRGRFQPACGQRTLTHVRDVGPPDRQPRVSEDGKEWLRNTGARGLNLTEQLCTATNGYREAQGSGWLAGGHLSARVPGGSVGSFPRYSWAPLTAGRLSCLCGAQVAVPTGPTLPPSFYLASAPGTPRPPTVLCFPGQTVQDTRGNGTLLPLPLVYTLPFLEARV